VTDSSDDNDLMLAAGQGDRCAFGILVERYYRAIVQFAYRFLGTPDRDAAEDLAQDVFLAAWKAAPAFRPRAGAGVLTWLLRITTNICLNYRRDSRLRKAASLDGDGMPPPPGPGTDCPVTQAIACEWAEKVRMAIANLPPNQRAATLLRHFQGLSYSEIADVLDTSVSAVESLLVRARRTLHATLAAESEPTPQVFPEARVE
jgi:RNA polymerase sigma-70 factor (ECF subfamily)